MAFPKLLQKLFQNDGAGDKLRSEILPDMDYLPTSGGTVSGSTIINQVSFPRSGQIRTTSTGAELLLNYEQGAWLSLLGKDFPRGDKGGFIIQADGGKGLRGLPDGSLTWCGKPVLCGESGGFPVGFLALYAGSNVPDGWFRCDGSTVAKMATNYPKLYAVLGTNVLPNYTGRCIQGATSDINKAVGAGLPNIKGSYKSIADSRVYTVSGALYKGDYGAYGYASATRADVYGIGFDASKSNSIYGASTTVQPPAVKVAVLIKHD